MEDNYRQKGMRRALIRKLKEKGIQDEQTLHAMSKIPRHWFFDDIFLTHAYQDKAFPIAHGQTISQPYTVAFQTQLLALKAGYKILEVGTGSGYQAAVLSEMAAELFTIECIDSLSEAAQSLLRHMGYQPKFIVGDGSKGYAAGAPYDGILVTAGAPEVPQVLVRQLKPGGHLVIPVGDRKAQKMMRVTKHSESQITTEAYNCFSFVPLLGAEGWSK